MYVKNEKDLFDVVKYLSSTTTKNVEKENE